MTEGVSPRVGKVGQARGQSLAEFALVLPVLLLIVLGLIEFSRIMAIYSMVYSAARNATRYGAAVGNNATGAPYYLDCTGIRNEARRGAAALLDLPESAISVEYDDGQTIYTGFNCNPGGTPPTASDVISGDRLRVTVTATYQPLLPLVRIPPLPFTFISARTIVKEIEGPPECNDGLDNDGNGKTDYPADYPNCQSAQDNTESSAPLPSAACSNDLDDDMDGDIDYPDDNGCSSVSDSDETSLSVAFISPYPLKQNGNKPIRIKVSVTDEDGTGVGTATVTVIQPGSQVTPLTHKGGGVYGGAATSCYQTTNVSGNSASVQVQAVNGPNTTTTPVTTTTSDPTTCP